MRSTHRTGFSKGFYVALVGGLALFLLSAWLNGPLINYAPIRSKVAAVQAEHRNIAVALEAFHDHYGTYPTARMYYECNAKYKHDPVSGPPSEATYTLTTPLRFVDALPGDPFHDPPREYHHGYWSDGESVWILRSFGPDRASDADLPTLGRAILAASDEGGWQEFFADWFYDPTNGITSPGDIVKTGP